jgi:hypothetical protein
MKARILLVSILLLSICTTGISQSFNSISKKISKYEYTTGLRKLKKDYFLDIRKKLYSSGKLGFITKSDTLFLIESRSIDDGNFYGKIWSTYGKVEYTYSNRKFDFNANQNYTNYMCKLVNEWDTLTIRREEEKNSTMATPRNIYATRVIKTNEDVIIDCILFRDFFLLFRDR